MDVTKSAWTTRCSPSRRWLSSDSELGHAVDETNALNQFTESLDRVDAPPTLLGFETELQHHGERAVLGEGTLHSLGAVAQRGERGLDHVAGAHVNPMLGRKVVEGQQLGAVLRETGDGSWILGRVLLFEQRHRLLSRLSALGHPDLVQVVLGLGTSGLGQVVENIRGLVGFM